LVGRSVVRQVGRLSESKQPTDLGVRGLVRVVLRVEKLELLLQSGVRREQLCRPCIRHLRGRQGGQATGPSG
jgi:hypothetical protein